MVKHYGTRGREAAYNFPFLNDIIDRSSQSTDNEGILDKENLETDICFRNMKNKIYLENLY